MLESNIKNLVKDSLSMRVRPKSLNTFYYFHHVYNTDSDSYVSTDVLQNRLGIGSKTYKNYFDKWVQEREDDWVIGVKCKKIISWTPSFISLMDKTKDVEIPYSFFEKMYWQTMRVEKENLEIMKKAFADRKDLSQKVECFYKRTENSSFRWYNAIQNTTKEEKAKYFKGFYDVDIESCFSSICYHELKIDDERLNPQLKNEFRQWVSEKLDVDLTEAKQIISRLFTGTYTKYNKIDWYDELFQRINKAVYKEIDKLKISHPDIKWTHHQFFTYKEQEIIEKIIPNVDLLLRMHDGVIIKNKPDMDMLRQITYPHLLSVKNI